MLKKITGIFSARSMQKKYVIRRIIAISVMILLILLLILLFTKCGRSGKKEAVNADPVVIGPHKPEDLCDIVPLYSSYDYSLPVPENTAVSDSWFDDVLFIGDSRASGFSVYGILNDTDIVSGNSTSAKHILDSDCTFDIGSGEQSLNTILISKKYGKVYISLGTNDLSWDSKPESFQADLSKVVDVVLGYQSSASIYLMDIVPVSSDYSWSESLNKFNDAIASVAQQKHVYFLDV